MLKFLFVLMQKSSIMSTHIALHAWRTTCVPIHISHIFQILFTTLHVKNRWLIVSSCVSHIGYLYHSVAFLFSRLPYVSSLFCSALQIQNKLVGKALVFHSLSYISSSALITSLLSILCSCSWLQKVGVWMEPEHKLLKMDNSKMI